MYAAFDELKRFLTKVRSLVARKGRVRPAKSWRPVLEALEDRAVPSASPITLTGNVYDSHQTALIYLIQDPVRGLVARTSGANSSGTFATSHQTILGNRPEALQRVLTADLNKDGLTDLVFAASAKDGLHLESALCKGKGIFAPTKSTRLADDDGKLRTSQMQIGDVNGDGRDDLIFAFHASDGLHLSAALASSRGDGRFQPIKDTRLTDGSKVLSTPVKTGDVNGDGRTDLIFTFKASDGVHVRTALANPKGDGSFLKTAETRPNGSDRLLEGGVRTGDVNGDGRTDLVFAFTDRNGLHVGTALAGTKGDGRFLPVKDTRLSTSRTMPESGIKTGDVNGDGRDDIVFAFNDKGLHLCTALASSRGDGSFLATKETRLSDGHHVLESGLEMGDVNGDRRVDLIFSYLADDGVHIRAKLGRKDGSFAAARQVIRSEIFQKGVRAFQFGKDGRLYTVRNDGWLYMTTADGTKTIRLIDVVKSSRTAIQGTVVHGFSLTEDSQGWHKVCGDEIGAWDWVKLGAATATGQFVPYVLNALRDAAVTVAKNLAIDFGTELLTSLITQPGTIHNAGKFELRFGWETYKKDMWDSLKDGIARDLKKAFQQAAMKGLAEADIPVVSGIASEIAKAFGLFDMNVHVPVIYWRILPANTTGSSQDPSVNGQLVLPTNDPGPVPPPVPLPPVNIDLPIGYTGGLVL